MKRSMLALIASIAVATTVVAPAAPPAQAEAVIDWGVHLFVDSTSWSALITTNFLGCADLPMKLSVNVAEGVTWTATGEITGVGSSTVLETFSATGTGTWFSSIPGVAMCEHFNVPVAPTNNEYVAAVTVTAQTNPVTEQSTSIKFAIQRLWSHIQVGGYPHELRGGVSALLGTAIVQTNDGFLRPAPVALVTAERLEGATWIQVGQAMSGSDGGFVILADRLLPAGTYVRFLYPGDSWVAPTDGFPWQLREAWSPPVTPPPPAARPAPIPKVKATAVSSRSKLKVDVNPNMGRKYWTFQVQKQLADGTWKALKTYKTLGSSEKRTVNLPKGTYRVWVNPKFGYQGVMSAAVTLKR